MDNFKQRFFTLEEKVNELSKIILNPDISKAEIHYTSTDKEQGAIALNEFDTFRFVRANNWFVTEYSMLSGSWKHGVSCNSDVYFLINPTQEIRDYVKIIAGYPVDLSKYTICFKFSGGKKEFERALTQKEITDFYLFWYQGGPCYGKLSMIKDLRKEFETKLFEIETLPSQKINRHTPYDTILSDFVHGMNFSAILTVDFKNIYAMLPHMSYYLTPLNNDSLKLSLKSLTNTQATFELKYGIKPVPSDATFNWMISGVV